MVHRGNDSQACAHGRARKLLVGLALAARVALGKVAKPPAFPHFPLPNADSLKVGSVNNHSEREHASAGFGVQSLSSEEV